MTRTNQRYFVRELSRNVIRDLLSRSKDWPENWDGHELRRLLAKRFECAVVGDMSRARTKAFNNECIVRNLP